MAVWEVVPGKNRGLIERFMESKAILEKSEARVEVYLGNWGAPGEYHYVLLYDSWAAFEASVSKLGPGSEWAKMMQRRAKDEVVGEQTSFFTGATLN